MEMYSVDEILSSYAVCVRPDGSVFLAELSDFPDGVEEGNVIYSEEGKYYVDEKETKKRREEILEKQKNLRAKK